MRHESGLSEKTKEIVHRMLDKGYNTTSIACYIGVDQARVDTEVSNYKHSKSDGYIKIAKEALGFA
ncbi:MAG: hypothetical protein QXU82_00110 [Candidatus Aenigmatarchaeota archaeon]